MSRYDELAQNLWIARKTAPDHSMRVEDIIARFLAGFAQYCGIADGRLTLLVRSTDQPNRFNDVNWIDQALIHHRLGKKWIVLYRINFNSPSELVRHSYIGQITVKEKDSHYFLSFHIEESPSFEMNDATNMEELFDLLYKHICEMFKRLLQT
jgi:hypothetical protein